MITRELEDEHFKFWIEDGILFASYKHPIEIDINLIKQHIALREKISEGEKQYMCYYTKNLKSYSKEARLYATVSGQNFLHASCAIIESYTTLFLFNIYMKINKPFIPFKAFKKVEEGISWLKEIKKQNEEKTNGKNQS